MKKWLGLILCIVAFGGVGVYLTFFAGDTSKFDSQTQAYNMTVDENYDSDGTTYTPIYHFKVDGKEYTCRSKSGSSSYPNQKKNTVYYKSSNPEKCLTEYDKSSSKVFGIICLCVAIFILVISIINPKPKEANIEIDEEKERRLEEVAGKVENAMGKVALIYKRIILGIIILVLLVLVLFDSMIVKQTIKAKDYIETTATFVEERSDRDSSFVDYIYTFKDKKGNEHEAVVSLSGENAPKEEIKLKYDENNPKEYYDEYALFGKSSLTWFAIKVVLIILLTFLFFNKKLLSKIAISAR